MKDFDVSVRSGSQTIAGNKQVSKFKNFVVNTDSLRENSSESNVQNGIWFFPRDSRNSSGTSVYSYKVDYDEFAYMGKSQTFVAGRPELVSANLISYPYSPA